jgi:nucleoside-diphosphate-sugar epimerase/catechol 2,3-dioxygenase-like lactoylglutathione lyase family enzyme
MVLVTGATGLVGSHLALDLSLRGQKVVALKRKSSDLTALKNVFRAHPGLYEALNFVDADLLDVPSLSNAYSGTSKVYHCAGVVSFDPADAREMAKINIEGTANIVKLCIEKKIEKLCYVSSVSAINRVTEDATIDENTPWKVSKENTRYAETKRISENIVWKGMEQGLKAVIVNPTIILGPGDWQKGSSAMFQQVWQGLKFYPRGTGGFVDVRDVSKAMIELMESNASGERFIINGENLSYKKVFELIANNLGKPKPSIAANKLILNYAWRVAAIKKRLIHANPLITKETTNTASKSIRFSNEKVTSTIDIKFRPVEEAVQYTCEEFLKHQQQIESFKKKHSLPYSLQLTSQSVSEPGCQPIRIYGIQQIGIGVNDVQKAFEWYATHLESDVLIFDDSNTATHMAPYMGGQPHKKRAILAMNLQGGSGYELWQYLDRTPLKCCGLKLGDLGINVAKVKSRDVYKSYERLKKNQVPLISEIENDPSGSKCFFIKDPNDNILQVRQYSSWYSSAKRDIGGVCGCTIGVSNIDASLTLYSEILGYTKAVYDKTGVFDDLAALPNGKGQFRRILLAHESNRTGGFSKLFGESQIELIQSLNSVGNKIYENRYWGDIGFIHLCLDIRNMKGLVKQCEAKGFPFKVLSDASFKMGNANGHWGYIEDPDGTLIEFVETHKVPLVKQIGLSINLMKRAPDKPLPMWLIKAMSVNRVKFKKPGLNRP